MQYFDKFGEEIFDGDEIMCDNGEVEVVVACGIDDLGIECGKEGGPCDGECYPLSEFDLSEWRKV